MSSSEIVNRPPSSGSSIIAPQGEGEGSGSITGGGTANRLAKFTGAATIGNSGISDNGTTVHVVGENLTVDNAIVGASVQWGGPTGPTLLDGHGDPEGVTTANVGSIYVDVDTGTLYSKQTGSGDTGWVTIATGSAGPMFLPGNWTTTSIPASDDEDLTISSGGFTGVVMQRAGSIVGISSQVSSAITGGSLTLTITKNGTPVTLTLTQSSGTQPQFGHKVQTAGVDTYVAGDVIGVHLATSGDFAKADSLSILAFVEAQE